MNLALVLLAGDPLNPDPSASADPANTFYSPGIVGFLGTFFVVVGAILIILDLVRRIRRVNYRAQIQERLAAEQAELDAKRGKTADSGAESAAPKGTAAKTADGVSAAAKPVRKRPAPPAKPKRD
jgi:uncharacterized integral membrane protein